MLGPIRSVQRVVLWTCVAGALAVSAVLLLSATVWAQVRPEWPTSASTVGFFVLISMLGQVVFVRVRHGLTYEELTFFEVALAAGILLLAPPAILLASLAGMMLGELWIRREWIKVIYNLGNYATSTSVMIATYWVLRWLLGSQELSGGLTASETMLSAASIASLVVASAAFTAVNLAILARLLRATTGATQREVFAEEWRLSALMAVGSVGMGTVAVALRSAPAALPFALLPALALWYAYGASAQHAEARDRNRWLVSLGGSLAQHGRGEQALAESIEAVRNIVGAPEALVLDPARPAETTGLGSVLSSIDTDPGPRALAPDELPDGWRTGVVTRLDVGGESTGALLLGSKVPYRRSRSAGRTRGWSLEEADAPVLGALVAAVGSAMRAGAAFDALTEETEKLSAVVDNTSDGIAMVDDTGSIRLWSQTMSTMTGVDAGGLTDASAAPPIVRSLVDASRASRNATAVQVHLVRADGEELDVSLSTVRVREAMTSSHSDSSGWVSILTVHDETRERRVERMKTDFMATISHELRTPITPIKGYAHLLATRGERVPPEKRVAALQVISDRADHLSRLVDDLLLASQVSEGARLAIEMGVTDLREIVQQAVDTFPSMSSRIQLELPDQAVMVQCDRIRTVQCLSNLIGNAEKYAMGDSPVDVRIGVTGIRAHVHVRDHGPGIPASEQERVFERFYRREDPFTMRTGGAGLGLHIARELAVAMGGGLELRTPTDGSGAEFVLHLATADAPPIGGTQLGSVARMRPSPASPARADEGAASAASADTVGRTARREGFAPSSDGTIGPEAHRAAI